MESKNKLLQQIKARFSSRVLKVSVFGSQCIPMVWIDGSALKIFAEYLIQEGFSNCENLAVIDLEGALVFTYFLSSPESGEQIVLRMTYLIPVSRESGDAYVNAQSALAFWPSLWAQESEYSELFGVRFNSTQNKENSWSLGLLPEGWIGFPLRKDYVFPTEFFDLLHMRAIGQSAADDYQDYSDAPSLGGDA